VRLSHDCDDTPLLLLLLLLLLLWNSFMLLNSLRG